MALALRRFLHTVSVALMCSVGGWLATARSSIGLAAVAVAAVLALPASVVLASAVVLSGGSSQSRVVGSLIAADLLLIAWVARTIFTHRRAFRLRRGVGRVVLAVLFFVAWATVASIIDQVSITPLLRISLYAIVMVQLSVSGEDARRLYAVIAVFALVNALGGALEGQARLIGLFVGDPAQMGALLIAALVPMMTGELRFPGWQFVGLILVYSIWLTQTRSVWFASIAVVATWSLRRLAGRTRTILILGAIAIVGFKFVGTLSDQLGLNQDSANYRLSSVINGIQSGMLHPLFGSGWATVDFVDSDYGISSTVGKTSAINPYNLFVNVFASVGYPGVILLAIFLWTLMGHLVQRKQAPYYFAVAFFAISLTEMTLFAGSMLTVLFFVYSGLGLASGRIPSSSKLGATGPSTEDSIVTSGERI